MKKIIVVLLVMITCNTFGQKETYDFESMGKNAISVGILGATPALGVSYERIASKYVSLEIGVGIASIGFGMKVVPLGIQPNKFRFHSGIIYTRVAYPEVSVFYVPFGFTFYGKKLINFSCDFGPTSFNESLNETALTAYMGIKVGFRY